MKQLFLGLFFFIISSYSFAKRTEIVLWHSMAGTLGQEVAWLAKEFNRNQTQFIVKPVYKGNYIESLTSYAAAVRSKEPPALIQVFEVGKISCFILRV